MFRFLFRFAGFLILAAAFVAAVYDGTKSIGGGQLYVTRLGDTWNAIDPASLQQLQPTVERYLAPWMWDPVVLGILMAPTWLVFGLLGSVLILLGRKKKPLIGYARS